MRYIGVGCCAEGTTNSDAPYASIIYNLLDIRHIHAIAVEGPTPFVAPSAIQAEISADISATIQARYKDRDGLSFPMRILSPSHLHFIENQPNPTMIGIKMPSCARFSPYPFRQSYRSYCVLSGLSSSFFHIPQ